LRSAAATDTGPARADTCASSAASSEQRRRGARQRHGISGRQCQQQTNAGSAAARRARARIRARGRADAACRRVRSVATRAGAPAAARLAGRRLARR
jgi:hypothetical protein